MSVPVSVIVCAKNEENNIIPCLESVHGWADEIIVVDDESTDKTGEFARKYADKVFVRKMEVEGTHRNWADDQAKNDWILILDADERVTEELKKEIAGEIPTDNYTGFSINRRNFIGDHWVQYGGWYPSSQLRLCRKDKVRFEEVEVHCRIFLEGETKFLQNDILHYTYRNFEHFLTKQNFHTTLEAKKWINAGRELTFGRAMWRAFDRFPRTYFRKKGRKDGFVGFMVAFFASLYQVMTYAKYWEMQNNKNKDGAKD